MIMVPVITCILIMRRCCGRNIMFPEESYKNSIDELLRLIFMYHDFHMVNLHTFGHVLDRGSLFIPLSAKGFIIT